MNSKIANETQLEQDHGRQKYSGSVTNIAHDDLHTKEDWESFIQDKVGLASLEGYGHDWRHRMIQIIGLATSAVESFDRKRDIP